MLSIWMSCQRFDEFILQVIGWSCQIHHALLYLIHPFIHEFILSQRWHLPYKKIVAALPLSKEKFTLELVVLHIAFIQFLIPHHIIWSIAPIKHPFIRSLVPSRIWFCHHLHTLDDLGHLDAMTWNLLSFGPVKTNKRYDW